MLHTFKSLIIYIWPTNRNDIKFRIILAIFILIIAKVLTVLVPWPPPLIIFLAAD